MARATYGPQVKQRSIRLLQSIVRFALGELEDCDRVKVSCSWVSDDLLRVKTTLRDLVELTTRDGLGEALKKPQVAEALNRMKDFLEILVDERVQDQGSEEWQFTLKLWSRNTSENLRCFETEWENRRSPQSKAVTATLTPKRKPGAPMPRVRLPENFVDRSSALSSVKEKLLVETDQTLVVSAIAGLGGLGKSVLATAIVLDGEVQRRFEDGILWVTLGQNPDLQSCLGDWIRELDKSRDSFSATTLESASGYLHNLLAERRMLLVVDDVWNAAHAEWFRVGGVGCRVLVTTREARIEGAEVYPLALMSEGEAIDLVRRKLGRLWKAADEGEVRSFAKVLGYLPLALDLAANQVRDGLSWAELRAEFEDERRSVALEILDSSEAWEQLSEEEQRKYSLRACFNLSLKRLKPEQLRQFAWLGVLPEDVDLNGTIAEVLWDMRSIQAKKGLIDLRSRSFLTDGVQTVEGVAVYRVHDLMHDTARGLIEKGELGIENLEMAHGAFLERYRGRSGDGSWYGLANDGYIYRHLTWHLEMAGRCDEVHELMASGEDQNDWFEACDKIGQPGIFVEDVRRGWRLAEELYERDRGRAIVLQCRYALITGTLNSLVGNLSGELMAAFVKGGFWSIEQAWAYVEQIQDQEKLAEAIKALAAYLTKPLFTVAVEKAQLIQYEYSRAKVLCVLAQQDSADFPKLAEAARAILDQSRSTMVLSTLAKIDLSYFSEALEAVRSIRHKHLRTQALIVLAQIDFAYFPKAVKTARTIQREANRARVLSALAQIDSTYFSEALKTAKLIQHESNRAEVLASLAQIDYADFSQLLEAAQLIQDESSRAKVLASLAQIDSVNFSQLLEAAQLIRDQSRRGSVLNALVRMDSVDFSQRLEVARSIQKKSIRVMALSTLAQIDSTYFSEALKVARSIPDDSNRARALTALTQIDSADFPQLLEIAQSIQGGSVHAPSDIQIRVLSDLAKINSADFSQLFEVVRLIRDESSYARGLSILAKMAAADFPQLFEAARSIKDEHSLTRILSDLAKIDSADFPQLFEAAQSIQSEYFRTRVLGELAKQDSTNFSEALKAEQSVQSDYSHTMVLSEVAKQDSADFSEALEAVQSIQSEYRRASALNKLTNSAPKHFLPKIYQTTLEITRNLTDTKHLNRYLSCLPLTALPYTDWTTYLHLLAHRKRADLMGDLATLYPAILHLGGEDAGRGMVGEMGRICKQWK